jgi:hypothetical protein
MASRAAETRLRGSLRVAGLVAVLVAAAADLLGIDHKQLTYRHSGRAFRLTDVHGNVITPTLS